MNNDDVTKRCQALLNELGTPSFIVFGWQKEDSQYGVTYVTHELPANVAVKGMSWALADLAKKKL